MDLYTRNSNLDTALGRKEGDLDNLHTWCQQNGNYVNPGELAAFNGKPANHNLPTVEDAVSAITTMCPRGVHLAVIDLSRAYHQFPVSPTDWPLLAIFFQGG